MLLIEYTLILQDLDPKYIYIRAPNIMPLTLAPH